MKFFLSVFLSLTIHFLFAQKDTLYRQQDSVFTLSKDTLIGKITINKDQNQYIFKSQTTDSLILFPTKIRRFIVFSEKTDEAKQVYDTVFDSFCLLESSEQDAIILYAKLSYKKIKNDGLPYYAVTKKYALLKNGTVYNLRKESLRSDLLVLMNDCTSVFKRLKKEKVRFENLPVIVTEYNRCFDKK